jgi:hypothetical protein
MKRITKIDYGHIYPSEENLSFINDDMIFNETIEYFGVSVNVEGYFRYVRTKIYIYLLL